MKSVLMMQTMVFFENVISKYYLNNACNGNVIDLQAVTKQTKHRSVLIFAIKSHPYLIYGFGILTIAQQNNI